MNDPGNCDLAASECARIVNPACDMGVWFHKTNRALCMQSVLINTNLLEASRKARLSDTFALRLLVFTTLTSNLTRLSLLLRRKTLTLPSQKTAMAEMSFSVTPCAATTGRILA